MTFRLEEARDADAAAIAALRMAVSRELTARFGRGTWSFTLESEASVRADILTSRVLLVREHGTVIATLRLSSRPPWLGSIDYFTPCNRPLFLTSMAVAPKRQHTGVGRACLEEVKKMARRWPADAICLDAYDAEAGAGDFYRKCGFSEVRRAPYNGTPLIFFEYLVPVASSVSLPTA
jgi:GNAT superfamily N-acetyltransferase